MLSDTRDVTQRKPYWIIGVVLFIYFIILPLFWPKPVLTVEMPKQARINGDLEIKVKMTAWHCNLNLYDVHLMMDPQPGGTFHAVELLAKKRNMFWDLFQVNRFTFPYSRTVKFKIPVSKLTPDGDVKPGKLSGRYHVELDYPRVGKSHSIGAGKFTARQLSARKRFEIQIVK